MSEKKLTVIIQYIVGIGLALSIIGIILVLVVKFGMWLAFLWLSKIWLIKLYRI